MNTNDMKQLEQHVRRYWYSDGIAELVSGGMFLLLGLYFGIIGYFEEGSLVSVVLQVSMVLVFVAGALAVRWLVTTLKSRLTYPRTGYVEYRVKDNYMRRRRWLIVISALVISTATMVLVNYIQELQSMVLFTGLLVGVIFIALRGRSSGVKRFYVLGGLAILLGFVLAWSGLTQIYTLSFFYGLLGIAIMTSGGLVLRRYLSENPSGAENSNG